MNQNKRILIVDDNKEFCENLSDILEIMDYEVLTSFNGFNALKKMKKNNIRAIHV